MAISFVCAKNPTKEEEEEESPLMPRLEPYCLSRFSICCCYHGRHLRLTVSTSMNRITRKIVCPDRTEHEKKKT